MTEELIKGYLTGLAEVNRPLVFSGGSSGVGQATDNGGEIFNDYENNKASKNAHAEGQSTQATGWGSHAEGSNTIAQGFYSHAEGEGTWAPGYCQHAMGKFNIPDGSMPFIIGWGGNADTRKNIFSVDMNGAIHIPDVATNEMYKIYISNGELKIVKD